MIFVCLFSTSRESTQSLPCTGQENAMPLGHYSPHPMNCGIWEYPRKAGDLINNIEVLRGATGVLVCERSGGNSQEATGVTPEPPIKHKNLTLQDRDIKF